MMCYIVKNFKLNLYIYRPPLFFVTLKHGESWWFLNKNNFGCLKKNLEFGAFRKFIHDEIYARPLV